MSSAAIRVVIVDDHQLGREGLEALFHTLPGITVVRLAADGVTGVERVLALRPDVALVDLRMPPLDGIGVLTRLLEAQVDTKVIVITTFDDEQALLKASALGARGFLLKDIARGDLEAANRAMHAGERVFRPTVTSTLRIVIRPRRRNANLSARLPSLTGRELEVLRLMAGGHGNKQVAYALGLSEGTVKNHVSVILGALQAADRTRAVLKAIECGLV